MKIPLSSIVPLAVVCLLLAFGWRLEYLRCARILAEHDGDTVAILERKFEDMQELAWEAWDERDAYQHALWKARHPEGSDDPREGIMLEVLTPQELALYGR